MEPLTHFLTGAVVARTGFNRTSAYATTTLVLASEAPDIDVVARLWGPVFGFAHHRWITHTLLGAPFVAALVVAVVFFVYWVRQRTGKGISSGWLGLRKGGRLSPSVDPPPRWGLLFLYGCGAVLIHILLDFTNNYGVRPFMPFSNRWYSWDIVFIIEPLFYVVFLGALLLPLLFGLINEEIGIRNKQPRGRGAALLAIVAIIMIWGVRDYEHRRALAVMNSQLYRGETPVRTSAYPYYLNPFKWYAVVETGNFYERMIVDSLTPEIDPRGEAEIRYKPQESDVSRAAKGSYLGRVYMDWAQYPIVEVQALEPPQSGYWVRFIDLRFLYPERWGTALSANEILAPDLKPQDAWFGGGLFGSGRPHVDPHESH